MKPIDRKIRSVLMMLQAYIDIFSRLSINNSSWKRYDSGLAYSFLKSMSYNLVKQSFDRNIRLEYRNHNSRIQVNKLKNMNCGMLLTIRLKRKTSISLTANTLIGRPQRDTEKVV